MTPLQEPVCKDLGNPKGEIPKNCWLNPKHSILYIKYYFSLYTSRDKNKVNINSS